MSVNYWMNRLQNIDYSPVFVTLNPPARAPDMTFGHYVYDHPQFDGAALDAKNGPTIQKSTARGIAAHGAAMVFMKTDCNQP